MSITARSTRILFWILLLCPSFLTAQSDFRTDAITKVELDFYDESWEKILKAFKRNNIEKRLPARMVINEMVFDSVAVRFKGNSSYNNPSKKESKKLPFNIDINEYHKKLALKDGTNKLKLSNSFRDPTFIREVLSYEIIKTYMPAPKVGFFELVINGEDYGLYVGTSSINKQFLKSEFGTKKGRLFKCDPDYGLNDISNCDIERLANLVRFENEECYKYRYELKSKKGWDDFSKLINKLNTDVSELDKVLDVYATLWMHALNMVLVNLDSYTGKLSHNYYLYRDTSKVWQPIMWDLNLSFGGFPFDGGLSGKLSNKQLIEFPIFIHFENPDRPLISRLLENNTYRKLYMGMVKTISEDYFLNNKYKEMIAQYQLAIRSSVTGKGKKLYSASDFENNISNTSKLGKVEVIGIQELMDARMTYLKETRVFAPEQPTLFDKKELIDSSNWILESRLLKTDKAILFYRVEEKGAWLQKELKNELYNWKVTLPLAERPQAYFLQLENVGNASLQPSAAPRQFFRPE